MNNAFNFGEPSGGGFIDTHFDFTRCQRPDGTYYGTGGQCRKGTPADAKEGLSKGKMTALTKAVSGVVEGDGIVADSGIYSEKQVGLMNKNDQKAFVKKVFEQSFNLKSDTMEIAMENMDPKTAEKFERVLKANGGKIPAKTITTKPMELRDAGGDDIYEFGIEGKINGVPYRLPGVSILGDKEYEYGFEVG